MDNDFIKLNNVDSYHIEKELTNLGLECNIVNANWRNGMSNNFI